MRLPRLLTGTAIVAVLSGTAACGLMSVEPKIELRDAASAFTSASAGAMRFSIGSSAAEARTFSDQADKESADSSSQGSSASTSTSDADLNTLLSSHADLAYSAPADPKKAADAASQLSLHIGATDAGELRNVDQVMYAQVNMSGLVTEFPDMKNGVDSFRASLAGGPDAGGPPPAISAPATAVLDGKWVSLDVHADSWVAKQLTKSSNGGLATDYMAKVKALAGKAFGGGAVAVQRLDSDDKLGDHLVATTNLRKVYGNIRGDVASLFTGSAGTAIAKQLPAVTDVPDRNLTVSFWVKDGALSRVELDAAQFLDKPAGHLVLRIDALPKQKITAPSGAVAIDPKAIADQTGMPIDQLLAGGAGAAAGGDGSGGALDAHTVATDVDQDIRDMADQDGVAPSLAYLARARADMLDMDNSIVVTQVGRRIQVASGGQTACLALGATTSDDGTVTPGLC
ncbi:MAG: hypothetical protein QOJ68_1153 [Blastococcus sp.]|nr:hypothetical protein [Blastococcus sp.]